MVFTYRVTSGDLEHYGTHSDMRLASSALPSGAYTTFRTYQGNRILRLWDHLRRLELTVQLLGKEGALNDDEVRHWLAVALHRAGNAESRVRLTFTPPDLYISVEPFQPYPLRWYEEGVRCMSVPAHRDNPQAKSTSFVSVAAQAYQSLPHNVHEGLMLGEDGSVLEGLSSNFFAILEDAHGQPTLYTEEAHALRGVTRMLVLELAENILPIVRRGPHYDDLRRAKECFITSVSREIMPVVQVDNIVIGDGKPSPITRRLMQAFQEMIAREAQPCELKRTP